MDTQTQQLTREELLSLGFYEYQQENPLIGKVNEVLNDATLSTKAEKRKGYDMKRTRRQAQRERLAKLNLHELWDLWDKDEYGGIRPSDMIPILEAALGDDAPDDIERFGMDAWDYVDHLFEQVAVEVCKKHRTLCKITCCSAYDICPERRRVLRDKMGRPIHKGPYPNGYDSDNFPISESYEHKSTETECDQGFCGSLDHTLRDHLAK